MANKGVNKMSEELAKDYIGFKLGKKLETPNNSAARTLRRLAKDLEREHGELFHNMLKGLNSEPQSCSLNGVVFQKIAKEMFADRVINWGRIAVLYTFAGEMAVYCKEHHMEVESASVSAWLSAFVDKNLSGWIEKTGGWDDLSDNFKEIKDGNEMWWGNVLCTVGLVAGAAGAALVFAR